MHYLDYYHMRHFVALSPKINKNPADFWLYAFKASNRTDISNDKWVWTDKGRKFFYIGSCSTFLVAVYIAVEVCFSNCKTFQIYCVWSVGSERQMFDEGMNVWSDYKVWCDQNVPLPEPGWEISKPSCVNWNDHYEAQITL